ncbi:hypothetical protein V3N99_03820 [Dermatophilaceae bacterium Soc4.6]
MRSTRIAPTPTRTLLLAARARQKQTNIRPTHGTTGCRDVSMYRPSSTMVQTQMPW